MLDTAEKMTWDKLGNLIGQERHDDIRERALRYASKLKSASRSGYVDRTLPYQAMACIAVYLSRESLNTPVDIKDCARAGQCDIKTFQKGVRAARSENVLDLPDRSGVSERRKRGESTPTSSAGKGKGKERKEEEETTPTRSSRTSSFKRPRNSVITRDHSAGVAAHTSRAVEATSTPPKASTSYAPVTSSPLKGQSSAATPTTERRKAPPRSSAKRKKEREEERPEVEEGVAKRKCMVRDDELSPGCNIGATMDERVAEAKRRIVAAIGAAA